MKRRKRSFAVQFRCAVGGKERGGGVVEGGSGGILSLLSRLPAVL